MYVDFFGGGGLSVDESDFYFFSVSLQICVGLYIGLLNRNIEKEFA